MSCGSRTRIWCINMDKSDLRAEIGLRLRWARELFYPSQTEFARVMGVTPSTINKIENGERALNVVNIISAANKLRCGTEYLLTGDVRGVDRDLRRLLIRQHPELLQSTP